MNHAFLFQPPLQKSESYQGTISSMLAHPTAYFSYFFLITSTSTVQTLHAYCYRGLSLVHHGKEKLILIVLCCKEIIISNSHLILIGFDTCEAS